MTNGDEMKRKTTDGESVNIGHFSAHTDGFNIETFDRRSLYSIVLYLNDVESGGGGETTFYSEECKTNLRTDAMGRIVGDERFKLVAVEPVCVLI